MLFILFWNTCVLCPVFRGHDFILVFVMHFRILSIKYYGAREFMVPAHFRLRPKAHAEEDSWRTNGKGPNDLEMQPRTTLSSASYGPKGKNNTSSKVASETLLKEKASRVGPSRGYSVGMVQGKDVTFALNAPTNVLTILMGKDP